MSKATYEELYAALRSLVERCDGEEGLQPDGSNMDTRAAHAALGDFDEDQSEDFGEPVDTENDVPDHEADSETLRMAGVRTSEDYLFFGEEG